MAPPVDAISATEVTKSYLVGGAAVEILHGISLTVRTREMVAVSIGVMAVGVPAAGLTFAFAPPWSVFAVGFLVCALITTAATVLPTLPSLRRPEPRVIARLVAE